MCFFPNGDGRFEVDSSQVYALLVEGTRPNSVSRSTAER